MLVRHRFWLFLSPFLLFGFLSLAEAEEQELSLPLAAEASSSEAPAVATLPPSEGDDSTVSEPASPAEEASEALSDEVAAAPADQASPEVVQLPPFPIEENTAVLRVIERYQSEGRREVVGRWLDRSTRYLTMIREVFRKKGLPQDLAFTAMVESGFNPLAVSRAGAKGLWQFMEKTARRYGLRVDRWVDERLDPEKSTVAAAEYLRDLFDQFGHWFLAQAAYNAGEVKVARAVARARTNDFWVIARGRWLREETKQFVPQIQAAALIAREPERYGFLITPESPLDYEVVSIPFSVDLKRLAIYADLAPELLRDLNPELRRGMTPPNGPYSLKVPPGSTPGVQAALERLAAERAQLARSQRTRGAKPPASHPAHGVHVVKPRDTLSEIAKRYGVTVAELARLNGLDPEARIYPGDRIRITASVLPAAHEPVP